MSRSRSANTACRRFKSLAKISEIAIRWSQSKRLLCYWVKSSTGYVACGLREQDKSVAQICFARTPAPSAPSGGNIGYWNMAAHPPPKKDFRRPDQQTNAPPRHPNGPREPKGAHPASISMGQSPRFPMNRPGAGAGYAKRVGAVRVLSVEVASS